MAQISEEIDSSTNDSIVKGTPRGAEWHIIQLGNNHLPMRSYGCIKRLTLYVQSKGTRTVQISAP